MICCRFAQDEDLDFIKRSYELLDETMNQLYEKLVKQTTDSNEEEHVNEYWIDLINKKTGFILVALYEGVPAGMAVIERVSEEECHLEDLFVWKEFRKRGIGNYLVEEAKKESKSAGYRQMTLNVLANNINAKRVYEKLMFHDVKVHMICELREG